MDLPPNHKSPNRRPALEPLPGSRVNSPTSSPEGQAPRRVPRWSAEEDQRLAQAVRAGDLEAGRELFQRHFEPLLEFCHYRLGADLATAEDVVQDTLMIGLEKLGQFDGRSGLHTWLCGIAKNRLRGERRKRRPQPLADVLLEADQEIDSLLARVAEEPLPDWVLERKETQEMVGAALSSLPPEYTQLLVQKYLEERSLAEMAELAGSGVKATESKLHRARVAFERVLNLLAVKRGGLS